MFGEAGRNEQELVAVGPRGKIEAFVPGAGYVLVGDRAASSIGNPVVHKMPVVDDPRVAHRGAHHGASYLEVAEFVDAVRNGAPARVTVEDGRWSLAVGAAAHRSIDEGRAVRLGPAVARIPASGWSRSLVARGLVSTVRRR